MITTQTPLLPWDAKSNRIWYPASARHGHHIRQAGTAPSPKQPPQHELNEIARARCCPRCSELTRRAGLGGRQRQAAAEAAADVTSVRKIIALTSIDKKNNRTHPPSQNKRKRAWAVSPTMCRSRVTRLNGRQRAMGRGRCRWQMCHG